MRLGWVGAVVLVLWAAPVLGETVPLIEVTAGKTVVTGRELASTPNEVWLQSPDGRLHILEADAITRRRTVAPQFKAWSATAVRSSLGKELGPGFSSATTRRYIVFARNSQTAQRYAAIFEDTYKTVYQYFSIRGVELSPPVFPLVAIVFPDKAAFGKYATRDKIRVSRSLMGYYHTLSNRVALFEDGSRGGEDVASIPGDRFAWESIDGNLKDTIVHEATHQVAFNTGLHNRLGSNPKWTVEGLATVFETAAARNTSTSAAQRINVERFLWFGNYAKERRKPRSLAAFLSGDGSFEAATLDAYSEAWAFSFFLIETRPRQYVQYMKRIAARDAFAGYPAEERLADFQTVFGKDTTLLESQFLRYLRELKK